jgi:hypothetical protein
VRISGENTTCRGSDEASLGHLHCLTMHGSGERDQRALLGFIVARLGY